MIILFTDFGVTGPYVGQMKSVLLQNAPDVPIVDLFADAPTFDPRCAAYLLAAYVEEFPRGSVFLCVVDPGVGSEQRQPMIAQVDGRWFVGPDNGLFRIIIQRAKAATETRIWHILWRPEKLSNSFHGRDLFAPVAAQLATNVLPSAQGLDVKQWLGTAWPEDLSRIIYIDHFGNAMTGIRAGTVSKQSTILFGQQPLSWARTFSEVKAGEGFWYENANGLVELSVNQGNASRRYQLAVGDEVQFGEFWNT